MTRKFSLVTLGLLGIAACGGRKDAGELASNAPMKPDSLVPIADAAPPVLPPPRSPETVYVERGKAPPRTAPRTVPRPPSASASSAAGQAPPPVPVEPLPAAPPPQPAPRPTVLDAGTVIDGNAIDSIHSKFNKVGDVVHMRVAHDMSVGGKAVIPEGSVITLTVTAIAEAPERNKKGTLEFSVQSVDIGGRSYPLSADVTDYQYDLKARGVGAGEAAKVGGGAVIGGIIGRVIGGDKTGTVVGAVGGAAAGAAVASKTANRDMIVHAGGTMAVTLRDPFSRTH